MENSIVVWVKIEGNSANAYAKRHVQTCPDLYRPVKTCQDLSRLVQTCPDLSIHVQTCSDMSRLVDCICNIFDFKYNSL